MGRKCLKIHLTHRILHLYYFVCISAFKCIQTNIEGLHNPRTMSTSKMTQNSPICSAARAPMHIVQESKFKSSNWSDEQLCATLCIRKTLTHQKLSKNHIRYSVVHNSRIQKKLASKSDVTKKLQALWTGLRQKRPGPRRFWWLICRTKPANVWMFHYCVPFCIVLCLQCPKLQQPHFFEAELDHGNCPTVHQQYAIIYRHLYLRVHRWIRILSVISCWTYPLLPQPTQELRYLFMAPWYLHKALRTISR